MTSKTQRARLETSAVMRLGVMMRVALVSLAVAGCAPVRVAVLPGEDYVFPLAEGERFTREERLELDEAWREVLRGSAQSAEKRYLRLLGESPTSASVETGLAYAQLRGRRLEAAANTFASVLMRHPDYVPALIGAASTAVRQKRLDEGLGFYRHANGLSNKAGARTARLIRSRMAEIKMIVTERRVAAARQALDVGDRARARESYQAVLAAAPELSEVRLTLADLYVQDNDLRAAAEVLSQAPHDERQILIRLGEIHQGLEDAGAALAAFRKALALSPQDAELHRRVEMAARGVELQSMPEEYRRIYSAPHITRADLAALISVKIDALARLDPQTPSVATDISGSWAREHVIRILSYDILEVYPNHTFQPAAMVRRAELARAITRILDLFKRESQPAPVMSDMSPNNLYYRDAERAVAAGLLGLTRAGAFEPWRPVSGEDAAQVIEALMRLLGQ